nr:hypothetical protein [Spirosoma sp. KCTC 42546]
MKGLKTNPFRHSKEGFSICFQKIGPGNASIPNEKDLVCSNFSLKSLHTFGALGTSTFHVKTNQFPFALNDKIDLIISIPPVVKV